MLATFAFDVCHDVYRAAREVIDYEDSDAESGIFGEIHVASGPDAAAGLSTSADFARAGERALERARRIESIGCAQGKPHGDVPRVLPGRRGIPGCAAPSGHQRTDLGGLGGGNPHARGARADSLRDVSTIEVFSCGFAFGAGERRVV